MYLPQQPIPSTSLHVQPASQCWVVARLSPPQT
jgi:hypothetical protein